MKKTIVKLLWIAIGQFIGAVAFQAVLIPNGLVAVGLGGVATILNNLFGFNIQLSLVVLALPIMIWSYLAYNRKQVFYALYSFGIFTFYIGIVEAYIPPFVTDGIVAAASGGILLGLAMGIVLKQAVANGPESIVGMFLKEKRGMTVGTFFMVMNTVIICSSIIYGDLTLIVYSLISNYISSVIGDYIIIGTKRYYVVNIMSDYYLDITDYIRKELGRGVTFIQSLDTDNVQKKMLIKTVVSKQELVKLRDFVRQYKDDTFIYAVESAGLAGKGFGEIG